MHTKELVLAIAFLQRCYMIRRARSSRHTPPYLTVVVGMIIVFVGSVYIVRYENDLLIDYYNFIGGLADRSGDSEKSVLCWERRVELDSARVDFRLNLARAEARVGAIDRALNDYQVAIAINPGLYDAYNEAATICLGLKDYRRALTISNQALKQSPTDISVRYTLYLFLAREHIGLTNLDEARRNLVQAIQLDPTRGTAHCLLAQVLDAQSNLDWAPSERSQCAAMPSDGK